MQRVIPITTLFLDIGGVLLTNRGDHHARKRAAARRVAVRVIRTDEELMIATPVASLRCRRSLIADALLVRGLQRG
jgi:hypothetical protein